MTYSMGVPTWTGAPTHGAGFDRPCPPSRRSMPVPAPVLHRGWAVLFARRKVAQVSLPLDGEFAATVIYLRSIAGVRKVARLQYRYGIGHVAARSNARDDK
jgi:hypothetical protein